MDTHQKTVALVLQLTDALRRSEFTRRDPYHTKRRAYPRGRSPRRQQRRLNSLLCREIIKREQALERALRKRGSSWRELEIIINKLHGGNWSRVESAARGLLA